MVKINPVLQQKVSSILKDTPKADEDTIMDILAKDQHAVRLPKDVMRKGVREFLKGREKQVKAPNEENGQQMLDKLVKKVKRSELEIEFQDHPSYKFDKLGGISQTYEEIRKNIFMPIQMSFEVTKLGISPSKGFLLAGPLGSGKTLLANCILSYLVNSHQFSAYSIDTSRLLMNDSEQNMKKIFETAVENQPSIIFFDNIDLICNKDASKRPQGSPIFFLTSQMQKLRQENVYFLGSTSSPEKMDISLRKLNRFEKIIEISTNSDFCRQQILNKLLQDSFKQISNEEIVQLSKMTSGYMAADLSLLLKQSVIESLTDAANQTKVLKFSHLLSSLKVVQPALKKEGFTDIPKVTLNDVGGLRNIKRELQREIIIPMRQQAKFKSMNFDVQSGGVLLYGPPGCGKTMMAKAIANSVRASFIIVKGPELLNKYVGESEQAVRQVFGRAQRAAPCVIFFDQFDAIAPKRSDQGNQVTERVVNTLLTSLDGVEERKMVFVIAATNRKDMIDEAILRAGRIQKHIYVPQPDRAERAQILQAISKDIKTEKICFDEIAEKTEGFSGADLKFLIKEAVVSAVMDNRETIKQEDLDQSLNHLLTSKKEQGNNRRIQLEDEKQNEKYEYHMQDDKKEENEKQKYNEVSTKKETKGKIMNEFMDFIQRKMASRK